MNESTDACLHYARDISLHAAGCLSQDEEEVLREHLKTCPACRMRYEQCCGLTSALRQARPKIDVSRLQAWTVPANDHDISDLENASLASIPRTGRHALRAWLSLAAAAAGIAVMVGGWSHVGHRYSAVKSVDPGETVIRLPEPTVDEPAPLPIPTLLALQHAAAESDDSLDRLLAQNVALILPETPNSSLSPEQLP